LSVRGIVDRHIAPLVDTDGTPAADRAPGGIAAVYLDGERWYFPYGTINTANEAPTSETIFGLGSVTKTFTTAILGQTPGLFGVPVEAMLPPGFHLPWPQIPTFEQLATFTGGIDPSEPAGVTTQAQFVEWVNARPYPAGGLPAPTEYSDASIGLLGQTLMHRDGFDTFDARDALKWYTANLLAPLGMEGTGPEPAQHSGLATPFQFLDGAYQPIEYAPWCPWGTAGRMFSTAADMLRFLMAAVGERVIDGRPVPPHLLDGIAESLKPRASVRRTMDCLGLKDAGQAFAWVTFTPEVDGATITGKAGGLPGVSSYVAVNRERRYGVVAMLNMQGIRLQCRWSR
jgi:CubicO group peptidase (beta-lactamase class C family)